MLLRGSILRHIHLSTDMQLIARDTKASTAPIDSVHRIFPMMSGRHTHWENIQKVIL